MFAQKKRKKKEKKGIRYVGGPRFAKLVYTRTHSHFAFAQQCARRHHQNVSIKRSKDQKTLAPCVFMYTSGFIRQNALNSILVVLYQQTDLYLCRSSTEPSQQLCSVVPYLIEFTRVNSHSDSSKSNRCDMRHCEIKQLRSSHCHQEL